MAGWPGLATFVEDTRHQLGGATFGAAAGSMLQVVGDNHAAAAAMDYRLIITAAEVPACSRPAVADAR